MFRQLLSASNHTASIGIATCLLAAFALATPAAADDLASIPSSGDAQARDAFGQFAKSWMAKMHGVEAANKKNPTVRRGASTNFVGYRGFGEDYTVELRPTGHPSSPFIGILRYTERMYSCKDAVSAKCSVASSSPVTEIFRYTGGSWKY